jgi:hypothetical protein
MVLTSLSSFRSSTDQRPAAPHRVYEVLEGGFAPTIAPSGFLLKGSYSGADTLTDG